MVNVAKIYSTLGNSSSLIPLAVKDLSATAGMTAGSFVTGKEEGIDRFIDEIGTEAIWLLGIPGFKMLFDKTIFKAMKFDSKFDARNLQDEAILKKIKEYAPTEEIKNGIEKISTKQKLFKGAAIAKFIISTGMAIGSYIGLTKFKQNYTNKKIRENLIAEYNTKLDSDKNKAEQKDNATPVFKGFGRMIKSIPFDPVKNMWLLDGSITAERLLDSRSPQEFIGYGIKEATTLCFMYYAGKKIQDFLEVQAEKKGKSISLDARVLENGFLKDSFNDASIEKSLNEFKKLFDAEGKLKVPKAELYDFIHKNPDNLIVKTAKMSDIVQMYKEPQGLFKKGIATDKIDTRKYIDLDEFTKVGEKIKTLYGQYKTALQNGETADDFFNAVKKLKRSSIIKNIGTCIFALGIVTPGIMLVKRFFAKDDQEFHTKKEIREQLIKEGIIV